MEVAMRVMAPVKASSYYYGKSNPDPNIGWVSKPDFTSSYPMSDFKSDSTYQVTYQTSTVGFRSYGDVGTRKPKVFFVGDSYTQSAEVDNDQTFYELISDSLNVEVFAYGQAGYGTLQQYMIIDQYLDQIKPDLVVLQVCDNDYIDNYAPLEVHSSYKVGLKRPYYYQDGSIKYHTPQPRWQRINDRSRFLKVLRQKLQNSIFKYDGPSTQELMSTQGKSYQPYTESVSLTEAVFARIKERVGHRALFIFSASTYQPMLSDMHASADTHGIRFEEGPARIIEQNRVARPRVNSSDGYHWNRHGQKLVAVNLIPIIKEELGIE